jgi:hypothetical protein
MEGGKRRHSCSHGLGGQMASLMQKPRNRRTGAKTQLFRRTPKSPRRNPRTGKCVVYRNACRSVWHVDDGYVRVCVCIVALYANCASAFCIFYLCGYGVLNIWRPQLWKGVPQHSTVSSTLQYTCVRTHVYVCLCVGYAKI